MKPQEVNLKIFVKNKDEYYYGMPTTSFRFNVDMEDLYKVVSKKYFNGRSLGHNEINKKTVRYREGFIDRSKELKDYDSFKVFWSKEFSNDPKILKSLLKTNIDPFLYWKFFKGKEFTYRRWVIRYLLFKTKQYYFDLQEKFIKLWCDKKFLQIMNIGEIRELFFYHGDLIFKIIKPKDLKLLSKEQHNEIISLDKLDFKSFKQDDLKYLLDFAKEKYQNENYFSNRVISKVLACKGESFFKLLKNSEYYNIYKGFLTTNAYDTYSTYVLKNWEILIKSKKSYNIVIKEFLNQLSIKQLFYLLEKDPFSLAYSKQPRLRTKLQDMFLDAIKVLNVNKLSYNKQSNIPLPLSLIKAEFLTKKSIRKILKTLRKYAPDIYEKFIDYLIRNIKECPPYITWCEYDTVSHFGITLQQVKKELKEKYRKKNLKNRRRKINGKRNNNKK